MTTIILFWALVSLAIVFLFAAPPWIFALRMLRARKLSEARAELAACAAAIQPFLASGEIACGCRAHDLTAEMVNRAQYSSKYVSYYLPWGARRRRIGELVRQMHKELNRQPEEFRAIYIRFINAMWKAARYRQPTVCALIFSDILVRVAIEALRASGLRAFENLKDRAGEMTSATYGVKLAPV